MKWTGITATAVLAVAVMWSPCQAASQSWVASNGTDPTGPLAANPCSFSKPCRTLQAAHDWTEAGGTVFCIDDAAYGPLKITKSITIDCHNKTAVISPPSPGLLGMAKAAVLIDFSQFNANDTMRLVRLRGLTVVANKGLFVLDAQLANHTYVVVDDCTFEGSANGQDYGLAQPANSNPQLIDTDAAAYGILDTRTNAGALEISNTIIRNFNGPGVDLVPAVVTSQEGGASAMLDNVRIQSTLVGVRAAHLDDISVSRSTLTWNYVGVYARLRGQIGVYNSVLIRNTFGARSDTPSSPPAFSPSPSDVRISNSIIVFNDTVSSGFVLTWGNNTVSANPNWGDRLMGFVEQ